MLKERVDCMTIILNVRKASTSVEQSHATLKLIFVRYSKRQILHIMRASIDTGLQACLCPSCKPQYRIFPPGRTYTFEVKATKGILR